MAVSLTHTTVATGTDAGNGEIAKAEWNEAHTLAMATARLLGRTSADAGAVEEIAVSSDLSLGSGTLGIASSVVTTTGTQTLTNKTLTDPAIVGAILEDVFTITDGAAFEIDPGNGTIQILTLGASRTPKATNFAAGESVTLMVDDGTAYTLTWTDTTFGTGGVVWVGGSAPTLATSGYTVLEFFKVGSQVYGALVGDVA
jgi:hypothetical protein